MSFAGKFATAGTTTQAVPPPLESSRLPLKSVQDATALVETLASTNPQFAALLKQGATPAIALARLGEQFFAEQRFAEAATIFGAASSLDPTNALLWTNRGTALDCAGSFAEAAACLGRSLELAGNQADTWLLLGLVKKKIGDLQGCESAYRSAIRYEPKSAVAWQCLGLLKDEQRDYSTAIECLSKAVEYGAADVATLGNLAKLYYQVGRTPDAADAYERARALDPSNARYAEMARKVDFVRDVLSGESVEEAVATYGKGFSLASLPTNEDQMKLLQEAFGYLSGFGHLDEAKRVGARILELQPDNVVLNYLMKSISRDAGVSRSPSEYVSEYFDSFASGFDAKLVDVLRYDVPAKLCTLLQQAILPGRKYRVLDAGCGTGLCGPLLRPLAASLVGVDLSLKMLDQAAKRGVYDGLVQQDLLEFLDQSPGQFDLVVAADVVVYIGDLASLFEAAAQSLFAGGLFAFSTESWNGDKYFLQPSGRFSHSPSYVRALAKRSFTEHACVETMIRLEANVPANGNLFIFRRRS